MTGTKIPQREQPHEAVLRSSESRVWPYDGFDYADAEVRLGENVAILRDCKYPNRGTVPGELALGSLMLSSVGLSEREISKKLGRFAESSVDNAFSSLRKVLAVRHRYLLFPAALKEGVLKVIKYGGQDQFRINPLQCAQFGLLEAGLERPFVAMVSGATRDPKLYGTIGKLARREGVNGLEGCISATIVTQRIEYETGFPILNASYAIGDEVQFLTRDQWTESVATEDVASLTEICNGLRAMDYA